MRACAQPHRRDKAEALPARELETGTRAALPIAEAGPAIRATIAEALALALADRTALPVVVVDAGAGKSREALALAHAIAGGRVIFALPTVEGAEEKRRELAARVAGARSTLAAGAMRDEPGGCIIFREAAEAERSRLQRHFAAIGRGVCQGCAFKARCPAAEAPIARPGVATFAAHDAVHSLARDLPGARPGEGPPVVVFYDDQPKLVRVGSVSQAGLLALVASPFLAAWREHNSGAGEAAAALVGALERLARDRFEARAHARKRHALILPLALVWEPDPDGVPYLDETRAEWACAKVAEAPPRPDPEAIRANGAPGWPDPRAWEVVQALLNRDPRARLRVPPADKGGPWTVELFAPWAPPEGAAVVVLTATPNTVGLEAAARLAGRTVRWWRVDVAGDPPRLAWHLNHASFTTDRLANAGGKRKAAENLFALVAEALPTGWQATTAAGNAVVVGVITHKALADALRGEGAGAEAEGVAALADDWRAKGITLEIGHFGKDGVASNRFAEVAVLVVAGDPRKNRDAALAEAEALNLDGDGATAYLAAEDDGAAIQALARARHTRRGSDPPALIWGGLDPPPVDGGWTPKAKRQGSHSFAELARGRLSLETIARELAKGGALSGPALVKHARAEGVSLDPSQAARVCAQIAAELGWMRFEVALPGVRGRPPTVYAATREAAEAHRRAETAR